MARRDIEFERTQFPPKSPLYGLFLRLLTAGHLHALRKNAVRRYRFPAVGVRPKLLYQFACAHGFGVSQHVQAAAALAFAIVFDQKAA